MTSNDPACAATVRSNMGPRYSWMGVSRRDHVWGMHRASARSLTPVVSHLLRIRCTTWFLLGALVSEITFKM